VGDAALAVAEAVAAGGGAAEGESVVKHVLLLQLDGKTPNLALMRLAGHRRRLGDRVELRRAPTARAVEHGLYDSPWHRVYASAIFERTRPVCRRLKEIYSAAVIGGSGWDESVKLSDVGVSADTPPDYSDYGDYPHSIGFTQRGCRLNCPFCKVPVMEGRVSKAASVWDIWRGEPWPRHLLLLDNDFFGEPNWRQELEAIRSGGFRVCWNQGFNVRLIGDEEAAAIAGTNYYDDQFQTRRLYTAWDNRKDEARLFKNLDALARHGVKPDHVMVYMLIGYWGGPKLTADDFHRQRRLREFGCRPYPMPYVRTPETRGFQRWVVGTYDKRVSWADWERAGYEPRKLGWPDQPDLFATAEEPLT
jgi:hypothetical protein